MSRGFLLRRTSPVLLALLLVGCHRAPAEIATPKWDPATAADRALSDYDSNGDHKLSPEELKKCPGLFAVKDRFDSDRDGSISRDELISQLHDIRQQDAALVEISCVVTRNGQPLEGATVKLIPESFMGDDVKPASGITGRDGTTFPSLADEELPENYRGRVHGVPCGIFRVVVTHPSAGIPAKFNTQTEIGRVISRRDHEPLMINL
jgi:hypothetical protein